MFVGVALMLMLAGASPTNETCKRLAGEFDTNEYAMAMSHDLNESMYKIQRDMADAMTAADTKYGFYNSRETVKAKAQAETTKAEIASDDEKHLAAGDRITALLIANKCPPPDHVTSWFTYSKSNPNRKEYKRPAAGQ